jgi:hypothetical protein
VLQPTDTIAIDAQNMSFQFKMNGKEVPYIKQESKFNLLNIYQGRK